MWGWGFIGLFVDLCSSLFIFGISCLFIGCLFIVVLGRMESGSLGSGCLCFHTVTGAVVGVGLGVYWPICRFMQFSVYFFGISCLFIGCLFIVVLGRTESGSLVTAVCGCLRFHTVTGAVVAVGLGVYWPICKFMQFSVYFWYFLFVYWVLVYCCPGETESGSLVGGCLRIHTVKGAVVGVGWEFIGLFVDLCSSLFIFWYFLFVYWVVVYCCPREDGVRVPGERCVRVSSLSHVRLKVQSLVLVGVYWPICRLLQFSIYLGISCLFIGCLFIVVLGRTESGFPVSDVCGCLRFHTVKGAVVGVGWGLLACLLTSAVLPLFGYFLFVYWVVAYCCPGEDEVSVPSDRCVRVSSLSHGYRGSRWCGAGGLLAYL